MERGGTGLLVDAFLEGVTEAGAQSEVIYLQKRDIKHCLSCFSCWVKTPGKCVQKDDMTELLPKIEATDVLVLATPLFVDGMTSKMKTMLDRTLPLLEPFFEIRDDHCRHPRRLKKPGKILLLSVSGFTELDNFDPLVHHVQAIAKNMGRDYAGALLRPIGATLPVLKRMGIAVDDVFVALKQAGVEVIQKGQISEGVMQIVSRELVPREAYIQRINQMFQRQIDAQKPK
jgi:multimeric flavodoxin WrbA